VLLLRAGSDELTELDSTDPPLGIVPTLDPGAPPPELSLVPGDILMVATDGLVEARRADGELFGVSRTAEVMRANRAAPARSIAEALVAAEAGFRADEPQKDDLTLVVVKVI
jgi:sigma-B regulation protein RsbU (phosphoserine phosphatase)